jgi:hypothetical protein
MSLTGGHELENLTSSTNSSTAFCQVNFLVRRLFTDRAYVTLYLPIQVWQTKSKHLDNLTIITPHPAYYLT